MEADPDTSDFTVAETAYIMPVSLSPRSEKSAEVDHTSNVWEVVSRFSDIDVHKLNADTINRHEDILTLSRDEHSRFVELKCWFEVVEGGPGNTYVVGGVLPARGLYPRGSIVALASHDALLHPPI